MKRIEISILKPSAALQAFTQTWQDAQMEEAVTPRLVFGSFGEFFAEMTERRLTLLRQVAAHEGQGVEQLAQVIGQPPETVRADATALVELGLLDQNADGGLSAPYDEILIHADIRDAA
jgi:predicted transcriptional regulator